MALTTTWTAQDAVAFTAGTLANVAAIRTQVEKNIGRGTLSSSTTPTSTEVDNWIVQGKQKVQAAYNFGWSRKYVYADTVAATFRYALPADFTGGATILRDLTQNKRLDFMDPTSFDSVYVDPAGGDNAVPAFYTIKDRELWLQSPASGVYRLELEFPRSGDDSTATDISYLPELVRFDIADFATQRAFMRLQDYAKANQFKVEWAEAVRMSRKSDSRKKWASMNYQARNWHNVRGRRTRRWPLATFTN